MNLPLLFFHFLKFLLFILLMIYVPGATILFLSFEKKDKKIKISPFLSTGVGLAFFIFLSFWLKIVHLEILIVLIDLVFLLIFLKEKVFLKTLFLSFSKNKKDLFIIILAGVFQASLLLKSGTTTGKGIVFWGVNGYDGIWHSALIAEISRGYPYQNPGFAGYLLQNYHFLTDLLFAQIHFLTRVPILDIYFKFAPLFLALLLNFLIYELCLLWTNERKVGVWSIFFVSFAGSFGWVLPLFEIGSNNWETAFWSIQTPSSFINPPFGFSLILITTGLTLFHFYYQEKEKKLFLPIVLVFGLLVGVKIYGALIVLTTLGLFGIYEFFKSKKSSILPVVFFTGLFSFFIYLLSNIKGGDYLVFKPWWFIRTMIQAPDRVNWVSLESRRQVYFALREWHKLIVVETIAFLLFLVGNLGSRIIGFFRLKKIFQSSLFLNKFFLISLPVSFFPPLFFLQKGVWWNTIQFFYYFVFFFSFLAGFSISEILKKIRLKYLKVALVAILVGISIPSSLKTFWWYTAPTPTTILEKEEKEALDFLKSYSREDEIILTYPFQEFKRKDFLSPPVPMTYYNSPYVSFFSDRRVFLEDQNTAFILDYPLEERLNKVNNFFQTSDTNQSLNFLRQEKVNYIYLVNDQKIVTEDSLPIEKVFDNGKVRIFKISGIE